MDVLSGNVRAPGEVGERAGDPPNAVVPAPRKAEGLVP